MRRVDFTGYMCMFDKTKTFRADPQPASIVLALRRPLYKIMRYLFAICSIALVSCNTLPEQSWQDALDAFIAHELEDKGIPALSIVVVDSDGTAWSAGYGDADATGKTRVSPSTVYRVASVSKLFTALAVMQLVEKGELDLDAPVLSWIPSFQPENPFGTAITLRQLLSHRSGLVREPPVGHYFDPTSPPLTAVIESLNETRLIVAPESRTKYSNAAVSVAGYIVAQATGIPFEDHVQAALIDPMGLEKTSFRPREDLKDELGIGYMWRYDTADLSEAPVFELGIGPAANLYTTTHDLAQFITTLFAITRGERPDLLSTESLAEMWTVQFADPGASSGGFGLGFNLSSQNSYLRVQHAGVMYGYATRVYAIPDLQIGVAIVANLDAVNPVVDRIGHQALDLLIATREGRELPQMAYNAPVDSAFAREADGAYGANASLVERNGELYLEWGGERVRVRSNQGDLVTDGRLRVDTRLALHGDTLLLANQSLIREPRTPPMSPPERFADLIGEYGWDHNALYVYEEQGQLHALIEWFFRYPLHEIAPDVYSFPSYGLYIDETLNFLRDTGGKVKGVSMEGVVFERRNIEPRAGETFRITPLQPIEQLRTNAMASTPPATSEPTLPVDLVELVTLDSTIRLDVRYATTNNFMGAAFYSQPRAFLQRPAAYALVRAHQALATHGYGLIVYDGYRPWHVTKMFFDATPDSLKLFVADPSTGSRHNRGCAVDVGLYSLETGEVAHAVSGYDEFTPRAFPDYPGGTALQRYHRELLRDVMEEAGFTVYEAEWWHFDYKDWRQYPIINTQFSALD